MRFVFVSTQHGTKNVCTFVTAEVFLRTECVWQKSVRTPSVCVKAMLPYEMSECRRFSCIISLLCVPVVEHILHIYTYIGPYSSGYTIYICSCISPFSIAVHSMSVIVVDGEMQRHAPYASPIDNHMAIKMYTQSVSILYVYCVIRSLARACVCVCVLCMGMVMDSSFCVRVCVYASGYATNELKTKIKNGKHRIPL